MRLKALAAAVALAMCLRAQSPAQAAREVGEVTAGDPAAKTITIRTDAGATAVIHYDESTTFRKVAAGQKDLAGAAAISPSEIAPGDRIVARGSADGASLNARSVMVMPKADVVKKQAADRAEWERRGIYGTVTSINPQAREIAIKVPGTPGQAAAVTVALAEGARVRRYAPESVKFSDAKPSRIEEIQPGDEVRALGTRSPDGARFTAEELVSGSFVNIAATVNSVDAGAGSLNVTDLATKKKVVVLLTPDSGIRRLPEFAAYMLANRRGEVNGPAGPAGPAQGIQGRREGASYPLPPSGAGGPGGMRGRPRDLQSMLERIPPIPVSALKPGDAVIIASTRGADPSRMTAINILAGVEPLLGASQNGRSLGSWNLDLNMNMSLP